jgi:phage replication O-like protein O
MCASPQIENGHTQIANEILEQLARIRLSPNQWQVILCIIRKTYGYHKKADRLTNTQICEATGLCKSVVSRTICLLEMMNLITRRGKIIGFQKDWEKWEKLAKLLTNTKLADQSISNTKLAGQLTGKKLAISTSKLADQSTKVSSSLVTQKKKETIQKKVVETLEEYTARVLAPRFPNLDLKVEREKFDTWWGESKTPLTHPNSAVRNWCEKAEKFRERDSSSNSNNSEPKVLTAAEWFAAEEEDRKKRGIKPL